MELKFKVGDSVTVRGECGHALMVAGLSFSGSVGNDGNLPHTEETAYYHLRCKHRDCRRTYLWQSSDGRPRSVPGGDCDRRN
jgi:hypothetical protein